MVYMIDDVRSTVLTILNKENKGNLTPEQYNLLAKQAQTNVFVLDFTEYARLVAMKNARRLSNDYGDRVKILKDKIDRFTTLSEISAATPSGWTDGDDVPNSFSAPSNLYAPISFRYLGKEAEKVSKARELQLMSSNLTKPSSNYPIYSEVNGVYSVQPFVASPAETVAPFTYEKLTAIYTRLPEDPVWTYADISTSEEPIFDPEALDFKDFELAPEDAPKLVLEILKLAGVTIREEQVVAATNAFDASKYQKENS